MMAFFDMTNKYNNCTDDIGRHWLISETHNNVNMQYIHKKQTKAKSCSSK